MTIRLEPRSTGPLYLGERAGVRVKSTNTYPSQPLVGQHRIWTGLNILVRYSRKCGVPGSRCPANGMDAGHSRTPPFRLLTTLHASQ